MTFCHHSVLSSQISIHWCPWRITANLRTKSFDMGNCDPAVNSYPMMKQEFLRPLLIWSQMPNLWKSKRIVTSGMSTSSGWCQLHKQKKLIKLNQAPQRCETCTTSLQNDQVKKLVVYYHDQNIDSINPPPGFLFKICYPLTKKNSPCHTPSRQHTLIRPAFLKGNDLRAHWTGMGTIG